ncbi:DNA primase [bacterium]|nr:DNA primase [bacterium]
MANEFHELVAKIKDKLDILDVVSEKVILKKSGANYWGLCPFHKEKTPSFSVNPNLGIYKCFGCGEGGDAISFIMKTEGKDFMTVISELAERFGFEMPHSSGANSSQSLRQAKDEMIKACQKAAEYYTTFLLQDKSEETIKVMEYLNNRGIGRDIIEEYSLGFASSNFTGLYDVLKSKFSDDILEKAGLITKGKNDKYVDRFRSRIIIPIRDEGGNYVAFGARATLPDQNPKYLNSSDSLIYNKSKILYGLYYAKDAIKEKQSIILMEGYFDVITAQAHGVKNAVASCGTSLTLDHVKLISRYNPKRKIYLSFDTDVAGQKATGRNADLIKEAFTGLGAVKQFDENYVSLSDNKYSCEIRVIAPPEGKDPDEFIRSVGAESYFEYIKQAPLLLDFQINQLLKEKKNVKTPLEKSELVKRIIPYLTEINNKIILDEYIKSVAAALDVDSKFLSTEVRHEIKQKSGFEEKTSRNVTKNVTPEQKAQKNLLSVFLVTDSPLNFKELAEKTANITFTDETLKIVKNTIDKSIKTVNNVKELIEELYTSFINNDEINKLITELITISETFSGLDAEDFSLLIEENITTINECKSERKNKAIRDSYLEANGDDEKALALQIQLKEQIK